MGTPPCSPGGISQPGGGTTAHLGFSAGLLVDRVQPCDLKVQEVRGQLSQVLFIQVPANALNLFQTSWLQRRQAFLSPCPVQHLLVPGAESYLPLHPPAGQGSPSSREAWTRQARTQAGALAHFGPLCPTDVWCARWPSTRGPLPTLPLSHRSQQKGAARDRKIEAPKGQAPGCLPHGTRLRRGPASWLALHPHCPGGQPEAIPTQLQTSICSLPSIEPLAPEGLWAPHPWADSAHLRRHLLP